MFSRGSSELTQCPRRTRKRFLRRLREIAELPENMRKMVASRIARCDPGPQDYRLTKFVKLEDLPDICNCPPDLGCNFVRTHPELYNPDPEMDQSPREFYEDCS